MLPQVSYEDDFLDMYGECMSTEKATVNNPRCRCLKTGWLGRKCPNWKPLGARGPDDLLKWVRENADTYLNGS